MFGVCVLVSWCMYRIGVVRAVVWYDYVWGMVALRVDWIACAFSCVVYVMHVLFVNVRT